MSQCVDGDAEEASAAGRAPRAWIDAVFTPRSGSGDAEALHHDFQPFVRRTRRPSSS